MASASVEVAVDTPPSPLMNRHDTSLGSKRQKPTNRLNSIRAAKDSAENLRRQKSQQAHRSRADSSASRARQFRVGNIGNNGLIYLRSVQRRLPRTIQRLLQLGDLAMSCVIPTDCPFPRAISDLLAVTVPRVNPHHHQHKLQPITLLLANRLTPRKTRLPIPVTASRLAPPHIDLRFLDAPTYLLLPNLSNPPLELETLHMVPPRRTFRPRVVQQTILLLSHRMVP